MISDKDISVTSAASWMLWALGGGLVAIGAFFDLWFTGVGLWLSGIGGVLSIRRMLCHDSSRHRNAFELGRDYERAGSVHSLR